MKVLHVNDCAGVARNLVDGLRMHGVEAEYYQPLVGTYRASKIIRLSLPITRTIEALWLRQYVNKHKIDIVHIHYARFAYMALITGIPYVLHIHGSDLRLDLTRPVLRELTILAIRKAKQVYYVTPDLENALKDIRSDVIFLPNPINLKVFSQLDSNVTNTNRKRILSISKLDKMKGVQQILSSIDKILDQYPEIEVAIFNFGNDSRQARPFFDKYKDDSRVVPISRVSHEDMPVLINSATLVLGHQSHEYGSLGVSELEAMACAKPVICDFAYPMAYTTPPPVLISRSPDEACGHMLRLLNDNIYNHEIGMASRKWVSSHQDLYSVAQKLLNQYIYFNAFDKKG